MKKEFWKLIVIWWDGIFCW